MIPQYFGKSDMVESLFLKLWTMLNWQRKCESLYLITVISSHCSSHHLEKCAFTPLGNFKLWEKKTPIKHVQFTLFGINLKTMWLPKCPVYSIWCQLENYIVYKNVQFTVFGHTNQKSFTTMKSSLQFFGVNL